jgi:hypothetical protein
MCSKCVQAACGYFVFVMHVTCCMFVLISAIRTLSWRGTRPRPTRTCTRPGRAPTSAWPCTAFPPSRECGPRPSRAWSAKNVSWALTASLMPPAPGWTLSRRASTSAMTSAEWGMHSVSVLPSGTLRSWGRWRMRQSLQRSPRPRSRPCRSQSGHRQPARPPPPRAVGSRRRRPWRQALVRQGSAHYASYFHCFDVSECSFWVRCVCLCSRSHWAQACFRLAQWPDTVYTHHHYEQRPVVGISTSLPLFRTIMLIIVSITQELCAQEPQGCPRADREDWGGQ